MPYSHPQPVDKATIYRDWKHILPGAMALGGTAGYINSVLLGFIDTPVSHMSGAVSRLGLNVAEGHISAAFGSLFIILGFLLGSILVGIFVGATKLGPSRRYGIVMLAEGLLLLIAVLLLQLKSPLGPVIAATACGLQNAMSSSYCGLMIRTTHVSGVVTDLGVMIGHWLRHRRIVVWKLKFLIAMLASFGCGGFIGATFDIIFGPVCLIGAASGCLLAGTLFLLVTQTGDITDNETNILPRTSIFPDD
jgi:uncharacterized membrane protein YoaK (UPF0700 family)